MSLLFFPLAVCHISRTVNYIPIGNIITLINTYSDFILCQIVARNWDLCFWLACSLLQPISLSPPGIKKILQHRTWTVVETSSSALAEHCMFASGWTLGNSVLTAPSSSFSMIWKLILQPGVLWNEDSRTEQQSFLNKHLCIFISVPYAVLKAQNTEWIKWSFLLLEIIQHKEMHLTHIVM